MNTELFNNYKAMKNISLIGASGFIGLAILKEALERGLKVTAVVRNTGKITITHKNLRVIAGDIMHEDTVTTLVTGADAVISSYNPGWTNPDIYEDTLSGYRSIISGVKKAGVKRLLVVGGAGSLFVTPGIKLMDTGVLPEAIMPGVKGLAEVYYNLLVPEKELDWVFFSPAGNIAPGERTGKFRLGDDNLITDATGESKISVEDYAMAMIDELIIATQHRKRMTIGY
jgi:putative NADH-flavin reductase